MKIVKYWTCVIILSASIIVKKLLSSFKISPHSKPEILMGFYHFNKMKYVRRVNFNTHDPLRLEIPRAKLSVRIVSKLVSIFKTLLSYLKSCWCFIISFRKFTYIISILMTHFTWRTQVLNYLRHIYVLNEYISACHQEVNGYSTVFDFLIKTNKVKGLHCTCYCQKLSWLVSILLENYLPGEKHVLATLLQRVYVRNVKKK